MNMNGVRMRRAGLVACCGSVRHFSLSNCQGLFIIRLSPQPPGGQRRDKFPGLPGIRQGPPAERGSGSRIGNRQVHTLPGGIRQRAGHARPRPVSYTEDRPCAARMLSVRPRIHGSKTDITGQLETIAARNLCVLSIDMQYSGDRKVEGKMMYSKLLYQTRDALATSVIDLRRGLDFLESRPDVDRRRLGYVGGAWAGSSGRSCPELMTVSVSPCWSWAGRTGAI